MTSLPERDREPVVTSGPRGLAKYCAELLAIGAAYFLLAKAGLLLASIHPSATPVWPAAGLALAAILLRGVRVWPAIFAGSLTANATNEIANAGLEGQLLASLGIAIGNTLEAVVSGQLITIWSGRARTFETPSAVAKFALLCLAPGTVISAILGVGSLVLAGSAELGQFPAIVFTWWLGNVAGALVVTPVIVLWTTGRYRPFDFDRFLESTVSPACRDRGRPRRLQSADRADGHPERVEHPYHRAAARQPRCVAVHVTPQRPHSSCRVLRCGGR